ncbi:MAG: hypothetical protein ACXWBH_02205 [Candidatus Angelobacter sp.]
MAAERLASGAENLVAQAKIRSSEERSETKRQILSITSQAARPTCAPSGLYQAQKEVSILKNSRAVWSGATQKKRREACGAERLASGAEFSIQRVKMWGGAKRSDKNK